jgi:hypothetical protein
MVAIITSKGNSHINTGMPGFIHLSAQKPAYTAKAKPDNNCIVNPMYWYSRLLLLSFLLAMVGGVKRESSMVNRETCNANREPET